MRINKISGKNIASLSKEFSIDLTLDKYKQDNIFAIVGNTGTGKSTILDTICLALYQTSARYSDYKLVLNDQIENIISRGQKEAYAKVEFTNDLGDTYAVTFNIAKTKNKNISKGLIIEEIDKTTGLVVREVSEGTYSKVQEQIINLIGINFEQFIKVVILPQNKFSRFLQSNDKERAEILGSISNGDIYKKISEKIYKEFIVKNDKIEEVNEKLKELEQKNVLTTEDEETFNQKLDANAKVLKEVQKSKNDIIHLDKNIESCQEQSKTQLDIEEQIKNLAREKQESSKDFLVNDIYEDIKCNIYLKENIADLSSKHEELVRKIENNQEQLTDIVSKLGDTDKKLKDAINEKNNFVAKEQALKPQIEEAKKLDTTISNQEEEINKLNAKLEESQQTLNKRKEDIKKLSEEVDKLNNQKDEVETSFNKLQVFSTASSELSLLEANCFSFQKLHRDLTTLQQTISKLDDKIRDNSESQRELQEKLATEKSQLTKYVFDRQELDNARAHESNLRNGNVILNGVNSNLENMKRNFDNVADFYQNLQQAYSELDISLQNVKANSKTQEFKDLLTNIVSKSRLLNDMNKQLELKKQVASLENYRQELWEKVRTLSNSNPTIHSDSVECSCPLCGSLEHPIFKNVDKNIEVFAQNEQYLAEKQEFNNLKAEIAQIDADLQQLQKQKSSFINKVINSCKGLSSSFVNFGKAIESSVERICKFKEQNLQLLTNLNNDIEKVKSAYNVIENDTTTKDIAQIIEQLEQKLASFIKNFSTAIDTNLNAFQNFTQSLQQDVVSNNLLQGKSINDFEDYLNKIFAETKIVYGNSNLELFAEKSLLNIEAFVYSFRDISNLEIALKNSSQQINIINDLNARVICQLNQELAQTNNLVNSLENKQVQAEQIRSSVAKYSDELASLKNEATAFGSDQKHQKELSQNYIKEVKDLLITHLEKCALIYDDYENNDQLIAHNNIFKTTSGFGDKELHQLEDQNASSTQYVYLKDDLVSILNNLPMVNLSLEDTNDIIYNIFAIMDVTKTLKNIKESINVKTKLEKVVKDIKEKSDTINTESKLLKEKYQKDYETLSDELTQKSNLLNELHAKRNNLLEGEETTKFEAKLEAEKEAVESTVDKLKTTQNQQESQRKVLENNIKTYHDSLNDTSKKLTDITNKYQNVIAETIKKFGNNNSNSQNNNNESLDLNITQNSEIKDIASFADSIIVDETFIKNVFDLDKDSINNIKQKVSSFEKRSAKLADELNSNTSLIKSNLQNIVATISDIKLEEQLATISQIFNEDNSLQVITPKSVEANPLSTISASYLVDGNSFLDEFITFEAFTKKLHDILDIASDNVNSSEIADSCDKELWAEINQANDQKIALNNFLTKNLDEVSFKDNIAQIIALFNDVCNSNIANSDYEETLLNAFIDKVTSLLQKIFEIWSLWEVRLNYNKILLRNKIKSIDDYKKNYERLCSELEEHTKGFKVIKTLNSLIGSASGDKFNNIAQQITLYSLVEKANKYLKDLRARYTLMVASKENEEVVEAKKKTKDNDKNKNNYSLNLYVIDHDCSDVVRSVASLSGGETFLVSLALALGISDMSDCCVKVETLFIDEGFDCVDAESLDIVKIALEKLKSDNKLIGIISHVSDFTNGMTNKILVEKDEKNKGFSKVREINY